jgi:prepilin-type processing-associated H-X9-DG protein
MASNRDPDKLNLPYRAITKADQIKRPSDKYVFVEEAYDGMSYNYNDECWNFIPYLSNGDYAYHMWDSLASFHVKSCTFGFADGHARKHKWRDKKTIDFFVNRAATAGSNTWTDPGNVDLEWLSDHYPFIPAK